MIQANYSLLNTILSTLPYYKSNADVISNMNDAMKVISNNIVGAREIEICSCIRSMLEYIQNGVEFDDTNLIKMSTSSSEMCEDILVKYKSTSEETKDFIRKFIDTIAINSDVLLSSEELATALDNVQNSPNNTKISALNGLVKTVEKISKRIDKKSTKKENRSVVFGKKLKGVGTIIEQLRHEEKNALSTGIPVIDEITGKYRPKKLYATIALSGGFKSGYLENITLGMSRSNPEMENIDGLENAILHITFENDLLQVFKRFIDYHKEEPRFSRKRLNKMKDDEILELAETVLAPQKEGDMSIVIQQYPRYSIKPSDVSNIITGLRRDGIRVCALVIDYADLMASPEFDEDDVEDKSKMPIVRKYEACKLLAQKENVPVITAGQFNRLGEQTAKDAARKYPSPLLGGLNASHIAGGFGVKYHVEVLTIQYRGTYNGEELLHVYLDKDRDGNVEEDGSTKENNSGMTLRFIKFEKNGFKISSDPKDAYTDIRDVVPLDDGSIISSAFKTMELDKELVDKMKKQQIANLDLMTKL